MKKALYLFALVAVLRCQGATQIEVWNRVATNAVVVCDGNEFELAFGDSVKINDADGLVIWQDMLGNFIASQSVVDAYTSAELVLCLDALGAPDIRYAGFYAEWERPFQWYIGGLGLGVALFVFAYSRRSADKLVGGGDTTD